MRADLELLQSGKSLARLHRTEARLRFVQRAGAVAAAIAAVVAAGWLWQSRQTEKVRTLAEEKARRAGLVPSPRQARGPASWIHFNRPTPGPQARGSPDP